MKECPLCREQIQDGAIKCRYCQSMLIQAEPTKEPALPGKVTYVVDRGLLLYLKCAAGVLVIMLGISAYIFWLDFKKGTKEVFETASKLKKLLEDHGKETEKQRKQVAGHVDITKQYMEDIKDGAEETERLQEEAEEANKAFKQLDKALAFRVNKLLEKRTFGVSKREVREIVKELLAAALPEIGISDSEKVAKVIERTEKLTKSSLEKEKALEKILEDAEYAVQYLNNLFGVKFDVPKIVLKEETYRNTYSFGNEYHAPPQVQHLPDITYYHMVLFFIRRTKNFDYYRQSGALTTSYADIFTSFIKQKRGLTPPDEDWLTVPGYGAWMSGEDIVSTEPKVPLRSLKAPGEAYTNHPVLGNDAQPNHIRDLYTGTADNGGVHINSGIPNKAFYETAIRIGSDTAKKIWYKALLKLREDSDFYDAANMTHQAAVELYGENSKEEEAVKKAWEVVGIKIGSKQEVSAEN